MDKVILITGARKGIGKELAEHYLTRGHKVAGCSRGDASIQNANYRHYSLDVSDEQAVINMVRDVSRAYGRIDALLNNAGIASMNHILTTPGKSTLNVFQTNVFGTFFFLREAAKVMMKRKHGRIINFSTVAVPLRLDGEAVYAASKAAVESLTRIAAKELGSFGITVNAIGPTPIKTDLIRNVPQDKIENLLNSQAIRRLGEVHDVINVADFYLSDASNFVTGQVVYLGGVG